MVGVVCQIPRDVEGWDSVTPDINPIIWVASLGPLRDRKHVFIWDCVQLGREIMSWHTCCSLEAEMTQQIAAFLDESGEDWGKKKW